MKKVLVTGASGLLGEKIVEGLAKRNRYEVLAVVSGRRDVVFPNNVKVEKANLQKRGELESLMKRTRPEIVCHMAWDLGSAGYKNSGSNMEWLEISVHLLQAFCSEVENKECFFFAGSSSQYGTGISGNSEIEYPIKKSLYGECKSAFEKVAQLYCEVNQFRFVSGRYFTVYGPRDTKEDSSIVKAIKTLADNKEFVCKSPNNLWNFVYVDDCAEATIRLLEGDCRGAYNIASENLISMREAFQAIASFLDKEELLVIDENPEQKILAADISRLWKDTNYKCNTDFVYGIRKTILWWENYFGMSSGTLLKRNGKVE